MCGLEIRVDATKVTSIRGNRDYACSRGHICPKGVSLAGFAAGRTGRDGKIGAIRKRGKLIVIDPVRTATAARADEWLPIVPSTDAALLLALNGIPMTVIADRSRFRAATAVPAR